MTFTDLLPMALQTLTEGGAEAVFSAINPLANSTSSQTSQDQVNDALDKMEWSFEALLNPVVSLLVNPQNIKVDKKVIFNKMQTKGGFVVQFWGPDLPTVTVTSKTGSFAINKSMLRVFQVLKTHVYDRRFSTRQPFKGMPIITMIWDQQVYEGFFQNFNYSLDAMEPYVINYTFTFTITNQLAVPGLPDISSAINTVSGVYQDLGSPLGPISSLSESGGQQNEDGWGVPLA